MDRNVKVRRFDIAMAVISLLAAGLSFLKLAGISRSILTGMFGAVALLCLARAMQTRALRVNAKHTESAFDICRIQLLDEDDRGIYDWVLEQKPAFLIGKSAAETADIDLAASAFSATIEDLHAVLNRAANRWYVEDISINGTVTLEQDGLMYLLEKGKACILSRGAVLHIGQARLLCV
jgi:hypothetical protein